MMLNRRLSWLFPWQAYSVIIKRQQHVPSMLPTLLRSCIFHLSRINSTLVTSQSQPLGQFKLTLRHFSASPAPCAISKKSTYKNSSTGVNETCQVFDQSEMLVGQMTIGEAEELARKENLKLFDMGVNSDSLRSFRLMSGRELAEESKRQKTEKKNKKVKEKEFRVTSNITDHDLEIKLRQARDVLSRGAQVKFVIKAHRRAAQTDGNRMISQLLKKVTKELEELAVIKQGIRTHNEQQLLLRPLSSEQPASQE